jgi:hypothetical protein
MELKGNVLLFYSFDIGDEIYLEDIESKGLLPIKKIPLSPYFKNYHRPLSFTLEDAENEKESSCILSKIHHFGVFSFCYKVPFRSSFDELKHNIIDIKRTFDTKSKNDANIIYEQILKTIKKPKFFNLDNFYFAVQVDPLQDGTTPEQFKEKFGEKIASLLRLEKEKLSRFQINEILEATISYSDEDIMVLDSEASFIYDDEYFESIEFFELANVQQLELQYFDRTLDQQLNVFYSREHYKIPIKAYIPFFGEKANSPIYMLSQLRVDISVITERLENSIKMAGDTYFSNFFKILQDQLALKEWSVSIDSKLEIIKDLYAVHLGRLDIIHDQILTLVIIVLIIVEALIAVLK